MSELKMKKIIRFKNLTTVIPMGEKTEEEIIDELADALEGIGARFSSFYVEVVEEEDE